MVSTQGRKSFIQVGCVICDKTDFDYRNDHGETYREEYSNLKEAVILSDSGGFLTDLVG
jgi:hypothetical protein